MLLGMYMRFVAAPQRNCKIRVNSLSGRSFEVSGGSFSKNLFALKAKEALSGLPTIKNPHLWQSRPEVGHP
jgi:hypothetical protein